MRYGILENNKLTEIIDSLTAEVPIGRDDQGNLIYETKDRFHPDMVAALIEIPDHIDIGWSLVNGEWLEKTEQELEEEETARHDFLKSLRDEYAFGGTEWNNLPLPTDERTQTSIIGARLTADSDPSYTVDWKINGQFITLDATAIMQVSDSIRSHVQHAFEIEKQVLLEMDNLNSFDEIEARYEELK